MAKDMPSVVLDRTKIPPDMRAHRVWVDERSSGRYPGAIAYVTETRRRMIGGTVAVLGFLIIATIGLAHLPYLLALVGLVVTGIGGTYALGGRSGFYEVTDDGSLGQFMGRGRPDVDGMRGMRV